MRRTRRTVLLVGLLVAAQAAAVLLYRYVEEQRRAPRFAAFRSEQIEQRGQPALPDVTLQRADGSVTSLPSLRGRPVLLHFWATWCPPCRDELPGLLALSEQQPELAVLALSLDDDWAAVQRFFSGRVPAAVVREPGRQLLQHQGVGELPDSYLLDREGRAVLRFAGARDWRSAAAAEALAPYLRR
jgi:thiol-disulfide isomerase/thioredoxin